MKIQNIYGELIYESEARNRGELVEKAVHDKVCLDFADLKDWDLSGLSLIGASFRYANLLHANLRGAHIEDSSLYGAYLVAADLRGEFDNVDFRFTNLRVAELNGSALEYSYGIFQFGPIGEIGRLGFAVNWGNEVMIQLGCFWGTYKEALQKVREKYGNNSPYVRQLKLAADIVRRKRWIRKEISQ